MNRQQKTTAITIVVIMGLAIGFFGYQSWLSQQNSQKLVEHIHNRLYIFQGNSQLTLPAGIGIDKKLWADGTLSQYGLDGISPIHTHYTDGVIHIESNIAANYTFGQFLDIWGVKSFPDGTALYRIPVNGTSLHDQIPIPDYRSHVFVDGDRLYAYIPVGAGWNPPQ